VAGIALLIPYYLMSLFAIEFPTVIGGAVSFFVMIFLLKLYEKREFSLRKLLFSFSPYWPVIILLLIGRYFFAGQGIKIQLGEHFSHSLSYFHPGLILLLVVSTLGIVQLKNLKFLFPLLKEARTKLWQ